MVYKISYHVFRRWLKEHEYMSFLPQSQFDCPWGRFLKERFPNSRVTLGWTHFTINDIVHPNAEWLNKFMSELRNFELLSGQLALRLLDENSPDR